LRFVAKFGDFGELARLNTIWFNFSRISVSVDWRVYLIIEALKQSFEGFRSSTIVWKWRKPYKMKQYKCKGQLFWNEKI
jgi:hypothetical protein